jgi:hypothetical protein
VAWARLHAVYDFTEDAANEAASIMLGCVHFHRQATTGQ